MFSILLVWKAIADFGFQVNLSRKEKVGRVAEGGHLEGRGTGLAWPFPSHVQVTFPVACPDFRKTGCLLPVEV